MFFACCQVYQSTRDNVHKMAEANKAFAHLTW
jgi:hypothetical protein